MITKAHNGAREGKITFAEALVRDPSYADLRPHLREGLRRAIEGIQIGVSPPGVITAMDPLSSAISEEVDRTAKMWGVPTEPNQNAPVAHASTQVADSDNIQITLPLHGQALADRQHMGSSANNSYLVRGRLKSLRDGHEIWLLTADERTGHYWPQGFYPVHFDKETGEWHGRINPGTAGTPLRVFAVVAPPDAQMLFRYFQERGDETRNYAPLTAIPPQCANVASVQTRLP